MEEEIIKKLKSRDQSGLQSLYKNYGDVLYGNILRVTNNDTSIAQEILQNTFLKIWKNIDKYESKKGGLFTWMNTIARNTALDKVRLVGYQQNKKTESIDASVYSLNKSYISASKLDVDKLLSTLEEKNKVVLDMIYLQGYSHRETAKILDLPLGTIKSRLRIGLGALRKEIDKEKHLFFGFIIILIIICSLIKWL